MLPVKSNGKNIGVIQRLIHLVCAMVAAGFAAPLAAQARSIYFEVLSPDTAPRVLPLAPGGSFPFSFTLRSGFDTGLAIFQLYVDSRVEALAQYSFVSSDPARCRVPEVEERQYWLRLSFGVGPLGREETIECNYTVTRSLDSVDDLGFDLCNWYDGSGCRHASFRVGTLPRMDLRVVPATGALPDGTQLVRLEVSNHGQVAVASRIVSTSCSEFGGGWFGPIAFTLDTDFPGACRSTYGQGCVNFGGQSASSYGFDMGPVAPGGTASCLVRVTGSNRYAGSTSVGVGFLDDRVTLVGGALAFDPGFTFNPSTTNGGGVISLGALPPVAAVPVPAGSWVAGLLALLVLAGAGLAGRDARPD
jgi:hypothetical protein